MTYSTSSSGPSNVKYPARLNIKEEITSGLNIPKLVETRYFNIIKVSTTLLIKINLLSK